MKLYGASDFEGQKINLEFTFSSRSPPSVYELYYKATTAFNNYFAYHGSSFTFQIRCGAIFDSSTEKWKTLHRSTPLPPDAQTYFFQVDIPESMGPIHKPVSSYPYLEGYHQQGHRGAAALPPSVEKESDPLRPPESTNTASPSAPRVWVPPQPAAEWGGSRERGSSSSWRGWGETARAPREGSRSVSPVVRFERTPLLAPGSAAGHSSRISFANLGLRGGRESVLRDEREKFEQRMNMPIDDLRQAMREESESLRRSLSQHHNHVV